jgi:hypothetical protein
MDTVHEFTLILEGIDELTSELANTIYGACDDASISQQGGRVQVDFDRSAPTMVDAVFSAIAAIQRTGIPARVRLDSSGAGSAALIASNVNSVVHAVETIRMNPNLRPHAMQLFNSLPTANLVPLGSGMDATPLPGKAPRIA